MTTKFDLWFFDTTSDTTVRVGTVDLDDVQELKDSLKHWTDLDTWKEPEIRFVPEGVEVVWDLVDGLVS